MAVCYDRLWHKLVDLHMTKTELRYAAGISSVTLAKLSKEETVSTITLEKICNALKCNVGDIMDVVLYNENTPNRQKRGK